MMSKATVINNFVHIFVFQVIGKSFVGDWFLIYLLGQNIDSVIFKDVIHELAKKLGYRSREIGETWLEQGDATTMDGPFGARKAAAEMNGGMNGGVYH